MKQIRIENISAYEQCSTFVNGFRGDAVFSDPMLSTEEQLRTNLTDGIRMPQNHAVLGVYRQTQMIGLFAFLVLREEQYLEMLVGLSRDADAYSEIFAYLERHYPAYHGDFMFNPNNYLLKEILIRKGAEFDTEQQKMVLTHSVSVTDTGGVALLSERYKQQYFAIHNQDLYWTAEKVAAAADRFRVFLAIENDKVVGYLDVSCCHDENEPYDFLVLPPYRKKGYGRKLLTKALQMNAPKGMMLLIEVDNTPAIRLYESMGFETAENQNSLTTHWILPQSSNKGE